MKVPRQNMLADELAQKIISVTAHASGGGAGMPPISSSRPSRQNPASLIASTVLANSGATLMLCVAGSNTGGLRSASAKRLGERSFGQVGGFGQNRFGGVDVEIAVASGAQDGPDVEDLEQVELEIADVGDVVAHGVPFAWQLRRSVSERGNVRNRNLR